MKVKLDQIRDPVHTIAATEVPGLPCVPGDGLNVGSAWIVLQLPFLHRGGEWNCLFHDGHVDAMTEPETLGTGTPASPRGMWTRDPND